MSTGLAKKGTRAINRAEIVDRNFLQFLAEWDEAVEKRQELSSPIHHGTELDGETFIQLFESQMLSRHLDLEARAMRSRNEGFYTIGSAGHEGNTVVGRVTRHTDPAFLHYRSGGFMMERSRKLEGIDPAYDTALSLAASSDDPISGGRHKVWGSVPLWVPPQTSTIASHLPKAVGAAIAIAQAKRLTGELPVPEDSITVCSFGDASANHATAQAGFNAAGWTSHQNLPCPILFVCEDNGIGISVQTPAGWIEASFRHRPGIKYFSADGLDLIDTWRATREAEAYVRRNRKPAFLHLKLKRLLGHAGTDVESDYRPVEEVEAIEAQDPLLMSAETALESGLMSAEEIESLYESVRARVQKASAEAAKRHKLESAEDVIRPQAPYSPEAVNAEATRNDYDQAREAVFGKRLPEEQPARHLSIQINRALHDLMAKYREMTVFGEDVAQKGGVYTVTSGLHRTFKGHRVFNTLLDETTILGMAQGQAMMGLLPVPEIQYLAYFHNACDQIRGEAASLQFFSNDQYRNPMILRIAGLAYQKGFGGHFHNDNSFTALRDIPGLVIACPSRGDDAAMMLRTLAALGKVDGRISAFLEPIALYMSKDLYEPRDGEWLFPYPAPDRAIPLGEGRVYHPNARDLLIITFGNGVPMSLRTARALEEERGVQIRILDLRWLKPLNRQFIAEHARDVGRVLVVDEGRQTGGLAEEVFTVIEEEAGHGIRKTRVCGQDSYIPLGDAANRVLMQDEDILTAARRSLDE
ncbi:2-oxoisovalerate dehydrogenase E1 component [Natronospira proteinivora]|uniref:3-methyl-2-oxobutanoate dehydrogenase (2-methylpropanoyl-transferring) n=1 Tax=Natronospira proteinivora TaxID=1807133 RepID=A0ABT1GCN9_9GAMM|nr:thiamine pyrophosphate-dependent enzyme [Natronospira proteinivora]MCP1728048.1 2-oxoisovalerate dehydrogenase E1 component [Natronospira proteinivora]